MVPKRLKASVRQAEGAVIMDLVGEIDVFDQEALQSAYAKAESLEPAAILLNFTHVNYINSKGIALIVGILSQALHARRRMLAYGLTDHFREIFEVTRLSDFMNIYVNEREALASLENTAQAPASG